MSSLKERLWMAAAMASMAFAGDPIYGVPKPKDRVLPKPNIKPVKDSKLYTFRVHGVDIQAYSKKDAIKRYNHKYKSTRR